MIEEKRPRTRLEIETDILSQAGFGFTPGEDALDWRKTAHKNVWNSAFDFCQPNQVDMAKLIRAISSCSEVWIKQSDRKSWMRIIMHDEPSPKVCPVLTANAQQTLLIQAMLEECAK